MSKLRIRVLSRDGLVAIEDLPHQNVTYARAFPQKALNTPAAVLPRATITLYPPTSEAAMAAIYQTSQLYEGQRVEIIPGGIGAQPENSYLIDRINLGYDAYTLDCVDTLYLAEQAIMERGETVSGTSDVIFAFALKDYALKYGDDFKTADLKMTDGSATPYTQHTITGTAGAFAAATVDGFTGAQITTIQGDASSRYSMYNPTAYVAADYQNSYMDAYFRITAAPATGGRAYAALNFGVTAGDNFWQAAIFLNCLNATQSTVANPVAGYCDLLFSQFVAGVGTIKKNFSQVFPVYLDANNQVVLSLQLRLQINWDGSNYNYRILVNGEDFGAIWLGARDGAIVPSGGIGVYAASTSTAATVFVSDLYFLNKQSIFQPGSIAAGTKLATHTFNQTTLLDVMNIAAGMDGLDIRKNAKLGWNNDTLDLGVLGAVTQVVWEEGRHIVSGRQEPNNEKPASEIIIQGKGGAGDALNYKARNLAALKKYGRNARQVNFDDVADYSTLRRLGGAVVNLASAVGTARTIVVNDEATDGQWREGDFVTIDAPSLGYNHALVQVMGYEKSEGSPLVTVHLGQYGISNPTIALKRLQKQIDNMIGGNLQISRITSTDGRSYLDLNVLNRLVVQDSQTVPVVRVEIGALSEIGNYGIIVRDASGAKVFDTAGLIEVMKLLDSSTVAINQTRASTSWGAFPTSTTSGFTLARQTTCLMFWQLSGKVSPTGGFAYARANLGGVLPTDKQGIWDPIFGGYTQCSGFLIATLAAGSYTAQIDMYADTGLTFTSYRGEVVVFQLGG